MTASRGQPGPWAGGCGHDGPDSRWQPECQVPPTATPSSNGLQVCSWGFGQAVNCALQPEPLFLFSFYLLQNSMKTAILSHSSAARTVASLGRCGQSEHWLCCFWNPPSKSCKLLLLTMNLGKAPTALQPLLRRSPTVCQLGNRPHPCKQPGSQPGTGTPHFQASCDFPDSFILLVPGLEQSGGAADLQVTQALVAQWGMTWQDPLLGWKGPAEGLWDPSSSSPWFPATSLSLNQSNIQTIDFHMRIHS